MKKKRFRGDSVQEALLKAGRFLEVEPEKVAYREVDRGGRRAVIEVDLDNPVRTEDAEPAAVEAPVSFESVDDDGPGGGRFSVSMSRAGTE